jgi:hypothetical protein
MKLDDNFQKLYHSTTQDAWLFKTHIQVNNCDFEFGMLGCDNAIADRIIHSGYKIINKPITFKIFHNDNVKGKNSLNFIEKHKIDAQIKSNKPKNSHPERCGSFVVPNYDKILIDDIQSSNGIIDLNKFTYKSIALIKACQK